MCGIFALIKRHLTSTTKYSQLMRSLENLKKRGPEDQSLQEYNVTINDDTVISLGFTRLAINGLTKSGMQPFNMQYIHPIHGKSLLSWICNGEIYNYMSLSKKYGIDLKDGSSDCYILGPLWLKMRDELNKTPADFFNELDGVFSMIIWDSATSLMTIARDPFGVRPLFYAMNHDTYCFSSELKGIEPFSCEFANNYANATSFPPGSFMQVIVDKMSIIEPPQKYFVMPDLISSSSQPVSALEGMDIYGKIKTIGDNLVNAVRKRLMTERPMASLLSGGLDSSLIASIICHEQNAIKQGKHGNQEKQGKKLETYSIGFEGSADLFYAKKVAEHIGSDHHEIVMTPDDFFRAIPEVIQSIESYDTTTVRASVGNWLICKEISKCSDAKVVFNGDGSDELFGSYLYFYRAPSDEEYEKEVHRLLKDIYLFDVLRSDRSISSHGLEARTPFLDKTFVRSVLNAPIDIRRPGQKFPVSTTENLWMERSSGMEDITENNIENKTTYKMPEKWLLRQVAIYIGHYYYGGKELLPKDVLWRRKEAFSDGVSTPHKPWYQEIKDRLPAGVDEKTYYYNIYKSFYDNVCKMPIPYYWMPKWSGETTDPSARTLTLY